MTTKSAHAARPAQPATSELFDRLRRNEDRRAREQLIERFLPLARKLAARYARSSEPYEDLVQVASVGLVKAVHRFDPDRGFAFTSFAVPTIVGELKRHFRDLGWAVHVERGTQERAQAIADARQLIRSETGRSPSVHELAQYLELSIDDTADAMQAAAARDLVSLDAPVAPTAGEAPMFRSETIGDFDAELGLVEERISVRAAAEHLPKLEREVLYLRYGAELTQCEIAERIGVSQMQVSRLLRRSLGRLREQFASERRS